MTPLDLLTAAVVAVVGAFAIWAARRAVLAVRRVWAVLVTELREIARIPAEVSSLVQVAAALVAELRALKGRVDDIETAFAALDMTPDHVTMTMLATQHREHEQERQSA